MSKIIDRNQITLDPDLDVDLSLDEMVAIVNYFHRDIIHEGILIAKTTKEVVEEYPKVMGLT